MKKIYTIVALFFLGALASKAQDTLLFNDFQQPHWHAYDTLVGPPGTATDNVWYIFNANGTSIPNAAPAYRPNRWFFSYPFSMVDRYATGMSDTSTTSVITPDSNAVLAANTWSNLGDGANALEANYFITPSVLLGMHDTLFWKSAPRQTPRYLDRYSVLISHNTNNDVGSFTDTIFRAAEMIGAPPGGATSTDTVFADFTFNAYAPVGDTGFIHGKDGMYMDYISATQVAPISHNGRLRPFSIPLDTYSGQTIFVAFLSNSHDDNLISIDDIMIRGANVTGIKENANNISLSVFPNPAKETAQLNFELASSTTVTISLYDIAGKLVYSENKGTMSQGRHFDVMNVAPLAKGFYTVAVQTNSGRSIVKLIVQ